MGKVPTETRCVNILGGDVCTAAGSLFAYDRGVTKDTSLRSLCFLHPRLGDVVSTASWRETSGLSLRVENFKNLNELSMSLAMRKMCRGG